MVLADIAINLVLGLLLGALGGLFGIGGGLIAIPTLGVLYGLDQQLAQGTALVMVVPNVLLGVWRYHQKNRFDMKLAVLMAGCSFICSWFGALIAVDLDANTMRYYFIGFLLVLTFWNIVQTLFSRKTLAQTSFAQRKHRPKYSFAILGGVAGFMGGLFGVGGAVIATPILTLGFGLTQVIAQGLSLALALPSTIVTLFTYAITDHVNWSIGLTLALGGMFGVGLGVKAAHQLPARFLRLMFSGFLLLSAILLWGQAR